MEIRSHLFYQFVLTGVLLAIAVPAHATFPGKNGRIVFIQGPDVYSMQSDGSDVRQLTSLTSDNPAFWATWSPNGKQLVFSEFPAPDGFGQLWMMNADGSNQHQLLSDPGYDDEAPSFSPDGKNVIFARCAPFHNEFPCAIYRIQMGGKGLTALTPVHIERGDFDPVYAPDGNTIAFDSYGRDGVIGAIYLMNSDGSDVRQVTPAAASGFRSDWSPDGQTLMFGDHCCNPQSPSIFSVRVDKRITNRLTYDHGLFSDFPGAWSPQGDAIVFQRVNQIDGSSGIWMISADGSGAKLIRNVQPATFHPRSPTSSHPVRPRVAKPARQIENGGALPRWGVAQ